MLKKKIKICHVVTTLGVGGMENGIVNLANNHNRDKIEIAICCLNTAGEMAERLKDDVKLYVLYEGEGFSLMRILRVARFFRKLRPDIVHTHAWGGGSLYGILGAKLAKVPVIINGEHGTFVLRPHQVILQRFLAAICNIILSVSESLKERVVKNLGIPPEKIKVIPNGVDTDIFSGKHDCSYLRDELKNRFGMVVNEDSIIIGCVGSLKPIKNQIMLLKALSEIRNKKIVKRLRVLFIGEGPDRKTLQQFVDNNDLKNNVVFLGNRKDVPQIMSLMNIFVSTSISEGMSNVLLEAFSSGIPVIATRTSEIVEEGCNGFLVDENDILDLADRIELLTNNTALRRKMGRNARAVAENKYSIIKMVSDYERFYLDLLRGRKG